MIFVFVFVFLYIFLILFQLIFYDCYIFVYNSRLCLLLFSISIFFFIYSSKLQNLIQHTNTTTRFFPFAVIQFIVSFLYLSKFFIFDNSSHAKHIFSVCLDYLGLVLYKLHYYLHNKNFTSFYNVINFLLFKANHI